MAGKLADGTSLADYNKAARERQSRGEYDETGAREAIERVRGRQTQAYSSRGEMMPGQSGGAFNPPKPPPPAKKPAQAVAKPAEPARQVAAMPKSQDHASPAKPEMDYGKMIADNEKLLKESRAASAPRPRPLPSPSDTSRERVKEWQKKMVVKREENNAGMSRNRAEKDAAERAVKLKEESQKAEHELSERRRQREADEIAATPGPIKVAKAVGQSYTAGLKGLYHAAKGTAKMGASAAKSVVEVNRDVYKPIYRWLTGDPEAKKRLANARK